MGDMTYRRVGASGLTVSAFGLGGWTTFGGSVKDEATVREIVTAARDAGVNLFDMADAYGRGECERVMGRALAAFPRHELVLTSKAYWPMSDDVNDRGLSRKHLFESVERSLKRLGTDYLDVYFCHRFDEHVPVEETARAMDDLVHQGKVLYWGTSEWTGRQLRDAARPCSDLGLYRPTVEQPQLSLLARRRVEQDVAPAAADLGMGLFAWSPLASGLLSGKYDRDLPEGARLGRIEWLRKELLTDANLSKTRAFRALADEAGCTRAQLALAWVASRPGVSSVLLGATSVEQLRENLGALAVRVEPPLLEALDRVFPSDDAS